MARRKLLKDMAASQLQRPNYLPEVEEEQQRLQNEEVDQIDAISENSYTPTERILLNQHKIKTFGDIGRECYGTVGEIMVNFMLFVQQIGVVIVYFYMLEDYFPLLLIILLITPICMF